MIRVVYILFYMQGAPGMPGAQGQEGDRGNQGFMGKQVRTCYVYCAYLPMDTRTKCRLIFVLSVCIRTISSFLVLQGLPGFPGMDSTPGSDGPLGEQGIKASSSMIFCSYKIIRLLHYFCVCLSSYQCDCCHDNRIHA